jgi:hypothetical protein
VYCIATCCTVLQQVSVEIEVDSAMLTVAITRSLFEKFKESLTAASRGGGDIKHVKAAKRAEGQAAREVQKAVARREEARQVAAKEVAKELERKEAASKEAERREAATKEAARREAERREAKPQALPKEAEKRKAKNRANAP